MTNADVIRAHFRALGSGLDAAAEFWAPEIEWRAVEGAVEDVGVIRGPEALRRYYRDWFETLDDVRAEVEEILVDDGERVAAVIGHSGRGAASGVPVQGRYYVSCLVRNGRILAGREYETRAQASEAVVPPPG